MPLRYNGLNPNSNKSKGEGKARFAPHKPLLLLCLFDMAEEGLIDNQFLRKSADLRFRFDSYWRVCQTRWGGQAPTHQRLVVAHHQVAADPHLPAVSPQEFVDRLETVYPESGGRV